MRKTLSILIPTYNDDCLDLVKELASQAEGTDGLSDFEIVVADDCSTDRNVLLKNREINSIPHCRMIEQKPNIGRSAIRNLLARSAAYPLLLFVDAGRKIISDNFIHNYLAVPEKEIIYGGHRIIGNKKGNLRLKYEKNFTSFHHVENRRKHPFQDFNTSNFLINREIMIRYPLDERFKRYGYEDVLYGKELRRHGFTITHIDNPVGFVRFEDNGTFLKKTEESLRTLSEFSDEIGGYSRLLRIYSMLKRWKLSTLFETLFEKRKEHWRDNLLGKQPSLMVFNLYKLGFFMSIHRNHSAWCAAKH